MVSNSMLLIQPRTEVYYSHYARRFSTNYTGSTSLWTVNSFFNVSSVEGDLNHHAYLAFMNNASLSRLSFKSCTGHIISTNLMQWRKLWQPLLCIPSKASMLVTGFAHLAPTWNLIFESFEGDVGHSTCMRLTTIHPGQDGSKVTN